MNDQTKFIAAGVKLLRAPREFLKKEKMELWLTRRQVVVRPKSREHPLVRLFMEYLLFLVESLNKFFNLNIVNELENCIKYSSVTDA